MIPLRYREKLPPYWYENDVAETHFAAAGGEIDFQKEKSIDVMNQFLLPYATWGLDIWDWIYFGDKQLGTYEGRREQIRKKNLAKAKFRKPLLLKLGNSAGELLTIREDFTNQEIIFEFDSSHPINYMQLSTDFELIRPVHVLQCLISPIAKAETIKLSASVHTFEVEYPICNMFYATDDAEGRLFNQNIEIGESARVNKVLFQEANTFYPTP